MSAAIVFENVGKSYPQYHQITGGLKNFLFHFPSAIRSFKNARYEALRNISFEIARGECVGILGRNGAGKSTMLGLIAGVLRPTVGKVSVKGRIAPLLELGAGFSPDLSGRENIFLNGVLMGMTREEVAKKAEEIIEFSELRPFIDQPIRVYSSGMLARLGFSIMSSLDPDLLLIDEVLAVGDLRFQEKCMERMLNFKGKGVTMVLVSHSLKHISDICDRVIWIEDHEVKRIGNPKQILEQYSRS